jgi:hypothetical protein
MSYNFNPMSDSELEDMDIIADGVYNFEVLKSTRKTSKKGNPMAEVLLNVWDNNGKSHHVFDYLVFSNVNLNIKKISRFCKAVGLVEEYKRGEIPEQLEKLSGKLELGTQEPQEKLGGGFYPKKNVVVDYVVQDGVKVQSKSSSQSLPVEEFKDDDLPF